MSRTAKSFAMMQKSIEKIWDKFDAAMLLSDGLEKHALKKCLIELEGISVDKRDSDYHHLKGFIYYMSNPSEIDEAQKSFQKALEINPVHEPARLYLGHCLFDKRKYKEADYQFSIVDKDEFNNFYKMKIEEMLVCCRIKITNLNEESISEAKALIYKYRQVDYLDDYLFNLNATLRDFNIDINELATQNLNVRHAKRKDLDRIIEILASDVLGKQREKYEKPLSESYIYAFEEIETDKNNELIIAELDDEIIGTLQITFTPSISFQGGKRAMIESVRVDAKYRNLGIGKKIMQWAINRAKEESCVSMQLTTNSERTDAYRFYENLGFIDSHIGMKLTLK